MPNVKKIDGIEDLTPDPNNINEGSERGTYMIERSLERLGAGRSIVVSADGVVIAGNKTLEGWENVSGAIKVIQTDGTELIVVQRTDIDSGDDRFTQLAVADNRTSQVSYTPDASKLLDAVKRVDLKDFFTEAEVSNLQRMADNTVDEMLNTGSGDEAEASEKVCPHCGKPI